jgi:hypothetical protein
MDLPGEPYRDASRLNDDEMQQPPATFGECPMSDPRVRAGMASTLRRHVNVRARR